MCTIFYSFRRKCEDDISASISLPAVYFTTTPESFRAAYIISYPDALPVIKYVTKIRGKQAAKFLLRNGIISGYKIELSGETTLFHNCTIAGAAFTLNLPWEKVGTVVTPTDVRRWAIRQEYRRCRKGLPLTGARLSGAIPMFFEPKTNKNIA